MRVHNTYIYTYTHIYPKDTTVDYVMSLPHARRLCDDACITYKYIMLNVILF